MVTCEKIFEKMPSAYMESFYSKCCGVSNANVNGTSYFMEPDVKLFTEDACQVYVPTFVHQEFSFGAIDNKTVGSYCINDQCNLYQDYNKSSFKCCPQCGNKLIVNVTHNVQGVFLHQRKPCHCLINAHKPIMIAFNWQPIMTGIL